MKPSFALNLNLDGVCLLHRAKGGWRIIGDVALDDPELVQNLSYLRRTATDLSGGQFACKLVLPNAQILYRKFDALGATDERRELAIRGALQGATPYAVDDLVFDWCDAGSGWAHVAAVARETLEEAEAFATEHRFNPVSFVALPDAGLFDGEPYFGQSGLSETLLPEGASVERDSEPLVVLGHVEAPQEAAVDGDDLPPASADDALRRVSPAEGVETEASADAPAATGTPPTNSEADDSEAAMPFSTQRSGTVPNDPGHATRLDGLEARFGLKADEKPAADGQPPKPVSARRIVEVSPMPVTDPTIAGDVLPKPRKKAVTNAVDSAADQRPLVADRTPDSAPAATVTGRRRWAKSTSPRQHAQAEAQALTVFGARRKDADGGKRKYLGLGLTLGIVTALLLAALFSGYLVGEPITTSRFWRALTASSEFSGASPGTVTSIAASEAITTEVVPSEALQPAPAIDSNIASLAAPEIQATDPRFLTPEEAAEAGPDIGGLEPLTLEQATKVYAASGIWPYAPVPPVDLDSDRIDNLYIASIDRRVIVVDAVALPAAGAAISDHPLAKVLSPPPAGTRFDLDARGFVRARADGALTSDGILVFSGSPAVIPILRPGTVEIAATEESVPDRLAAVRPVARPENLIEQDERARFGGLSRVELAAVRPLARAATPQDTDTGVDTTPTASAGSDGVAVASAAAAPRNVVIPTSASVAQAATVVNAISLSAINLIGVYGSQSNRRALVRLKSGRYVKVEVGDRLDGGLVAAIGPDALQYIKSGRTFTLELPKG